MPHLPVLDLLLRPDARHIDPATSLRARVHTLGDDQARRVELRAMISWVTKTSAIGRRRRQKSQKGIPTHQHQPTTSTGSKAHKAHLLVVGMDVVVGQEGGPST